MVSDMNVVCYEYGVLLMWSVMSVVFCECGLL